MSSLSIGSGVAVEKKVVKEVAAGRGGKVGHPPSVWRLGEGTIQELSLKNKQFLFLNEFMRVTVIFNFPLTSFIHVCPVMHTLPRRKLSVNWMCSRAPGES